MARKAQVSIQDSIETDEDFHEYLMTHFNVLLCLEVYSEFCGPCLATASAVRKSKLEIGGEKISMARAAADNIEVLERFRGKSEPVFLFITKGKLNRVLFGANGIELCHTVEEELRFMESGIQGVGEDAIEEGQPMPSRRAFSINAMLPEEREKVKETLQLEEELHEATERLRSLTLAARKKRVNQRLAIWMRRLNFVIYWPHCHHAHTDLYETWDRINIQVSAKDEFEMTEEMIKEAFYMSDVELNPACVYALTAPPGPLVVLYKMFDTDDRDFVKLMRYSLYEEIPIPKEDTPIEKQLPPFPAYERYASISKTAREVRRDRYNAKLAKLQAEREEAERLASEQARLARQEEEERQRLQKEKEEQERFARIQAGLPADPEPEEVAEEQGEEAIKEELEQLVGEGEEVAPEEKVEEEEAFHSDVSVEDEEFIPPGGLIVPGFYTPPNDLAKANGLALFFPKVVSKITGGALESEHLPKHVLVMFNVEKRHDIRELINQYRDEILQVGIFLGDDPPTMQHIAYSIKQYDKMERLVRYKDRIALMVSRKRSLPLLQLAGLSPCYISSDSTAGEKDCLLLFPVGYGDDFVEEESVIEEEVVIAPEPVHQPETVAPEEPKKKDSDDDDDD